MKNLKTTLIVMIAMLALSSCGNVAESEPAAATTQSESASVTTTTAEPEVATTEPVTTPKATEVTTTSEAVISIEFTTPEVTAPPVITTTTTATTTVTTTTAKQTTTTKKKTTTTTKKKTTTTAKKTTTTPKQTTTAPKKTTTAKKEDDSKWKLTGVLASYDRLRRGCQIDGDVEAVEEDLVNWMMDNYNGMCGTVEFNTDGPDAEANRYFGINPTREVFTLTFDKPVTLVVDRSLVGINNCHQNAYSDLYLGDSVAEYDDFDGETPEERYWDARRTRSMCCGAMAYGLYGQFGSALYDYGYTLDVPYCINAWVDLDDGSRSFVWYANG